MSLNEKSLKLIAEYLKQFNLEGVELNMPIEEDVYDLDETESIDDEFWKKKTNT